MEKLFGMLTYMKFPFYNFVSSFVLRTCLGYFTLKRKPIRCPSSNPVGGSAGIIVILMYLAEFFLESLCLGIGTIIAHKYNFVWNLSNYYVVPLYSIFSWPIPYLLIGNK